MRRTPPRAAGTSSRSAEPGRRGLPAVPRQTQKDRIYHEVRRALQAGKFEPGESVTVKLLAQELGAGLMPIREAVQRLAAEGALVSLPTGRVRVAHLTAREFDDIKEIRLRLEGLAASQAARFMDARALKRIMISYRKMQELVSADTRPTEIIEQNYRFHFDIYSVAENHHLLSIIDGLWLRVSPLLSIPFKASGRPRAEYLSAQEENHSRLIAALETGDGRVAEAAVREIILASAGWYHRHYRFASDGARDRPAP